MSATAPPVADYRVELPAGGYLHLQSPDEVDLWRASLEKYAEEYTLSKQNDLILLGLLLQQQIVIFRAQTAINGREPEFGANGVPTGAYRQVELDAGEAASWHKMMSSAATEMRALEKALGIDKATREQGGAHTTDAYIRVLKRAAHQRAVHIAKRTLEYERVINEARVRWRLLLNGDKEDRAYHDITPKTIILWFDQELKRLEEVDKKFNKEKGKIWLGKL